MKRIFLALFLMLAFMTNSFASSYSEVKEFDEPVIVILSCGGNAVFNDDGMTDNEIFDAVDNIEFFHCEGGSNLIWQIF